MDARADIIEPSWILVFNAAHANAQTDFSAARVLVHDCDEASGRHSHARFAPRPALAGLSGGRGQTLSGPDHEHG